MAQDIPHDPETGEIIEDADNAANDESPVNKAFAEAYAEDFRDRLRRSVGEPPMPASVAKAITEVMAGVERLGKTARNEFAKYDFTSVDDFMDGCRPLMAKAGLVVHCDEERYEFRSGNKPDDAWLLIDYRFTLAHKDGSTWSHRPKRTAIANAKMGSQAFGAAQSYVMKTYLRGLFLMSSGATEDLDSQPQTTLPSGGTARKASPKRAPGQKKGEAAPADPAATEAKQLSEDFRHAMKTIDSLAGLNAIMDNKADLEKVRAASQSAYDWIIEKSDALRAKFIEEEQTRAAEETEAGATEPEDD